MFTKVLITDGVRQLFPQRKTWSSLYLWTQQRIHFYWLVFLSCERMFEAQGAGSGRLQDIPCWQPLCEGEAGRTMSLTGIGVPAVQVWCWRLWAPTLFALFRAFVTCAPQDLGRVPVPHNLVLRLSCRLEVLCKVELFLTMFGFSASILGTIIRELLRKGGCVSGDYCMLHTPAACWTFALIISPAHS